MYVSVFMQTYKNVCKLKHKFWQSQEGKVANGNFQLTYLLSCFVNQQWIWNITVGFYSQFQSTKQRTVVWWTSPATVHKRWFNAFTVLSIQSFNCHSTAPCKGGKTLKMRKKETSKGTCSFNPADQNPKNINVWLPHCCNNSSGNPPPTHHLYYFPISLIKSGKENLQLKLSLFFTTSMVDNSSQKLGDLMKILYDYGAQQWWQQPSESQFQNLCISKWAAAEGMDALKPH